MLAAPIVQSTATLQQTATDAPFARVQLQSSQQKEGVSETLNRRTSTLASLCTAQAHLHSRFSPALVAACICSTLSADWRPLSRVVTGELMHSVAKRSNPSCSAGTSNAPCGDSRVAGGDSTGWLVLCRHFVEVGALRSCTNSSNTLFTFICS